MPSPKLRPMREEDASCLEMAEFNCGNDPWHKEINDYARNGAAWELHSSGKGQTLILVDLEHGDKPFGFASVVKKNVGYPAYMSKLKVPSFLITYLALDEKHQGKGYGKFLIRSIIATAKAASLEAVFLYVDSRNEAAKAVYNGVGFRPFTDGRTYSDSDDGAVYLGLVVLVTSH